MRPTLTLVALLALAPVLAAEAAPGLVEGAPNTRPIVMGDDAPACAPGSREAAVRVRVEGLRARSGTVRAELYPATEADWLKPDRLLEREGRPFRRAWLPVPAAGPVELCLKVPAPGVYGVSVVHQPSPRWKFDIFRDGAGFSGNPRIGRAKPRHDEVAFQAGAGRVEQLVVMNYLQGLAFRPLRRAEERVAGRRPEAAE
ncbi:MAG: DUF2141 domain-containing protein [Thermaurantiacus tibetensis]|uniref:DUF2141 domain-containing protein n=1 Tax=Thermaurantiacus tibetensis TaxID=2759035 RepID=UPI00188E284C|nr:DUF2141 domain-containing protein [Thermaurantiacus tibetensis]